MGRKLLFGAFLFVFCLSLGAQSAGPKPAEPEFSRFRVIDAKLVTTLRKELRLAADHGYRVIAAASGREGLALLLERLPEGVANRHYLVLASADLGSLEQSVNEAGMHGFRLLPQAVLSRQGFPRVGDLFWSALVGAMENVATPGDDKSPGPEDLPLELLVVMERTGQREPFRFHYLIFRDPRPTAAPILPGAEYSYAGRADAEIVAIVDHSEGVVLIQEERLPALSVWKDPTAQWLAESSVGATEAPYRIVVAQDIADMQKRLADYAGLQRRIINTSANLMRNTVLIAYREQSDPPSLDYMMVTARRERDLQKQLNTLAAQGYRVVPRTMLRRGRYGVMVVRGQETPTPHQYRVLSGTGRTLATLLNDNLDHGDLLVGFVKGSRLVVILETPPKP